jgi:hypothetical protein
MLADFKGIHSPDCDLKTYIPDDLEDFSIFVQVFFGPKDAEGCESFDFTICTSKWLQKKYGGEAAFLRNLVLVSNFNYDLLVDKFKKLAASMSGKDWNEIGTKLSRFGRWEFEDYRS